MHQKKMITLVMKITKVIITMVMIRTTIIINRVIRTIIIDKVMVIITNEQTNKQTKRIIIVA